MEFAVNHWGKRQVPLRFDFHPYDGHPFGYEGEVINVFEHFVEPGDLVVDAGASVGYHACFLSKLVGEDGVVMAFEPHFKSFKLLVKNVHIANVLNNVGCYRQALWNKNELLNLWSVPHLGYSSFHKYKEFDEYEPVEARTLDSILTGPDEHPRLIKIDCEGAEGEILCGAQQILSRGVDCVVVELNYHIMDQVGRSDAVIRDFMQSLGYDMFLINIGNPKDGYEGPIRVDPGTQITVRGGIAINVLFSTVEKVKERWKTNGISKF